MPTPLLSISLGLALLCAEVSSFQTSFARQCLSVQLPYIKHHSICNFRGTKKLQLTPRPTKATCLFQAPSAETNAPSPKGANSIGLLWGVLNRQTAVGVAVATSIITGAVAQGPPRLFLLHVAGMALGAFAFLPAALGATRSRAAAAQATANPVDRRPTLTRHIQAHFACSVAASLCWTAGLAGIVLTKNVQEKEHLASVHSWLGVTAVSLWAAAGITAELKVWERVIKQRRFAYEPRLLWASAIHRRFGAAASVAAMVAATSGVISTGFGRKAFLDPFTAALAQPGSGTMVNAGCSSWFNPAALSTAALVGGLGYLVFSQLWAASSEWRSAKRRDSALRSGTKSTSS